MNVRVPPLGERYGYFLVAIGVLLVDQVTKILAHAYLRGQPAVEVIPNFLNLWYSRNRGGLFGYFRDLGDPWRSLMLTLLPALAVILISVFLVRSRDEDRVTLFGLALILGGATGNLIDRVVRGEVVDFLDVYATPSRLADLLVSWFGTSHWPTFNVADSAIVCGAGCLLWRIFKPAPVLHGSTELTSEAPPRGPV